MKYYIGIDPGISGGLAVLEKNGKVISVNVMPTIKVGKRNKLDLVNILAWISSFSEHWDCDPVAIAAIEEQRAMPKQGVTSTFSIGQGYGQLEGICAATNMKYQIVRPMDWQREMFMGLPKGNTKDLSKLIAQRLFPNVTFKKSARCTNLHDGMTDAILIAEYARRNF